jgi:hypothetical protein
MAVLLRYGVYRENTPVARRAQDEKDRAQTDRSDVMAEDDTPVWTLVTPTGKRVECVMRFAPGGVELDIAIDGEPSGRQTFSTGTEAFACAEEQREYWENAGE